MRVVNSGNCGLAPGFPSPLTSFPPVVSSIRVTGEAEFSGSKCQQQQRASSLVVDLELEVRGCERHEFTSLFLLSPPSCLLSLRSGVLGLEVPPGKRVSLPCLLFFCWREEGRRGRTMLRTGGRLIGTCQVSRILTNPASQLSAQEGTQYNIYIP